MDKDYRPVARPDVERSQLGQETLLYNPENDKVTVLNETAAAVWEMCDGEHTLSSIEAEIRDKFNPPSGHDVAEDVRETVTRFQQDGILA